MLCDFIMLKNVKYTITFEMKAWRRSSPGCGHTQHQITAAHFIRATVFSKGDLKQ